MSRAACTVGPYARESNEIIAPNGETLGVAYQMESAGEAPHHCEETLANAALFTASWQMLDALKAAQSHVEYSEQILGSVPWSKETKTKIAAAIEAAEDYE